MAEFFRVPPSQQFVFSTENIDEEQFLSFNDAKPVKATQIFKRLNIDFKVPLFSVSNNRYILTVIDECSRFPFAFPCADMTPTTINQCLTQLFSIFGMCSYIHSDRWMSFQPQELKSWLHSTYLWCFDKSYY